VSTSDAAPCIHVFPAVVALARSFKGYAAFGRVMADASPEGQALLRDNNVVEVPTFLFFKNGREVERHVGSSRGDLIGKVRRRGVPLGRRRRSVVADGQGAASEPALPRPGTHAHSPLAPRPIPPARRQIMEVQSRFGVAPPPPPNAPNSRRIVRRVTRRTPA
jgi:hypothetical protein